MQTEPPRLEPNRYHTMGASNSEKCSYATCSEPGGGGVKTVWYPRRKPAGLEASFSKQRFSSKTQMISEENPLSARNCFHAFRASEKGGRVKSGCVSMSILGVLPEPFGE